MISVTDLSTYLFCPRKLFLAKVLKIKPPLKEQLVKGSIKHQILDNLNKKEESLVLSITSHLDYQDLFSKYQLTYHTELTSAIKRNRTTLRKFNIDTRDFLKQIWMVLLQEAKFRSSIIFDFMDQHRLYGENLWQEVSPKIVTELKLSSEKLKLRGIIDRVEIHNNIDYVPFELKSGTPPSIGIWPNQKIQLAAYIHLLEDFFKTNVNKGYIHYLDHDDKREVINTPELKNELLFLVDEVHHLLNQPDPPKEQENPNKCKNCSFKPHCFKAT